MSLAMNRRGILGLGAAVGAAGLAGPGRSADNGFLWGAATAGRSAPARQRHQVAVQGRADQRRGREDCHQDPGCTKLR